MVITERESMTSQRDQTDHAIRRGNIIIDCLKVKNQGFFDASDIGGGLKACRLAEPELDFGGGHVSTYFPSDFGHVRRFYSSSQRIDAEAVFHIVDGGKVDVVGDLREFINPLTADRGRGRGQSLEAKTNFRLSLIPITNRMYEDVIEYIKSVSKSKRQNVIVGMVTKGLSDYQFAYVKAMSILHEVPTHIINLDRAEDIVNECVKEGYQLYRKCPGYRAYMLNNYVQLYAKAGGMPWVVADSCTWLIDKAVIVGVAMSKYGREYFIGVAYAIAYLGKEVRSFVSTETFDIGLLNAYDYKSRGLYIPREVAEKLLKAIIKDIKGYDINNFIVFQTPVIHEEEIEGLRTVLGSKWILVHVKTSGFSKRLYDMKTNDGAPYRGVCIVDGDSLEEFGSKPAVKALITSTGKILARKFDKTKGFYVFSLENTYKPGSTPKPLELEIAVDADVARNLEGSEALRLVVHVGELILLLNKLDWESYRSWPKIPFVVKYAKRIANIISNLLESEDGGHRAIATSLVNKFKELGPRLLRYVM